MRRNDKEIKELQDIISIMERCDVCRLALNADGYPYIVPLNFGMKVLDDEITLYFHSAAEGKKLELMKKDNRVGFEMDCSHKLVTDISRGYCTMEYESVIGSGQMEMLSEEEKQEALCTLVKHYHQEPLPFKTTILPQIAVYRLVVETITGKRTRT